MKFKGKIDLWIWAVMILGEILIIWAVFEEGVVNWGCVFSAVIYNLCFLPFVFRNYVEFSEDSMKIAFGFATTTVPVSQIQEVYRTHNLISSTAASLDRIVIRACNRDVMCAVKEREQFFAYMKEKRPDLLLTEEAFQLKKSKTEKFAIIFCVVIFVLVGCLLVTGDIQLQYGEETFTIEASYWSDKEIAYEDIQSIEYVDKKVSGSRVGGFGSFRLMMGNFKNKEYGSYTRYTYADCDAGVVLVVNDREVVISGKDKEATKAIYEELLERMSQ